MLRGQHRSSGFDEIAKGDREDCTSERTREEGQE